MKKIIILIALFSISVFSQPIRADTTNSIVTKGTVSFKGDYISKKPSNTIPDGKTIMISNNKTFILPRTGEKEMSHLLMAGVVLASGLSVASLSSEGVSAAEKDNSLTTTGQITFKEDTNPAVPVDPTNPDSEVEPTNKVTPTDGPLSIDYASSFNFEEQNISAKDETYYASFDKVKVKVKGKEETETVERPNWVQVTDKRGTNAGWKLQLQQGSQFSTSQNGTSKELTGAQIKITNTKVATTTDNKSTSPTATQELVLTPGDKNGLGAAVVVMSADKNQGMGTWVDSFGSAETGNKSISLSIPGITEKVKDAKYTTDLTWSLTDTPV